MQHKESSTGKLLTVRGKGERSTEKGEVKNKRWSEMQENECCTEKLITKDRKRMNKEMGKEERSVAKQVEYGKG